MSTQSIEGANRQSMTRFTAKNPELSWYLDPTCKEGMVELNAELEEGYRDSQWGRKATIVTTGSPLSTNPL